MATSAAQLNGGGRGNTAGPVLSLRPFMFAEALSPVVPGLSDEARCAQPAAVVHSVFRFGCASPFSETPVFDGVIVLTDLFDLNGFLHIEGALSAGELASAQAAVAEAIAAGKRGETWYWNKAMEVSA